MNLMRKEERGRRRFWFWGVGGMVWVDGWVDGVWDCDVSFFVFLCLF